MSAMAICLCALFCSYLALKTVGKTAQITVSQGDDRHAEQKEQAKETTDLFFVDNLPKADLNIIASLNPPIAQNDTIDYFHYVFPETPPPNV